MTASSTNAGDAGWLRARHLRSAIGFPPEFRWPGGTAGLAPPWKIMIAVSRAEDPVERRTLAHAQAGRGRDVVLLHGAMTNLDDMAIALFPSLSREFRVTAFDRPGHGRNGAPGGGDARRQARQLQASIAALGLKRPVVVGHSFGGAVALAHAMMFPGEVAGVVALAPIAFPEPRLEHLLFAPRSQPGPLGFWAHSLGRMTDPMLLPLLWRAMFLPQAMPEAFAEGFSFDLAGAPEQLLSEGRDASLLAFGVGWNALSYRHCATPVHIFAGDSDLVVNPRLHADRLAEQLRNASLTKLPGLGHMLHHFAQPAIRDAIDALQHG